MRRAEVLRHQPAERHADQVRGLTQCGDPQPDGRAVCVDPGSRG